jgi:uncharacterized protein YndB with AHSA1/START domain
MRCVHRTESVQPCVRFDDLPEGYHRGVSINRVHVRATPEAVFDVLDDPCAYPRWVVGARRVRAVDPTWPAVGSRFHHAIGAPGAELHDNSKVLARDRPRHLSLEVRFRPTGVARVDIDVTPRPDGCEVTMEETPTDGPVHHLPRAVIDPALRLRNALSLFRLRREAERSRNGDRSA